MDVLIKYFTHFGEILLKVPEDMQSSLISAIYPTLVCKDTPELPRNFTDSNLEAAIKGNLPAIFINLMRSTNSLQLYQKLLKLNASLILVSYNWSLQVILHNFVETLLHHMNPDHCIYLPTKTNVLQGSVMAELDQLVNDSLNIIFSLLEIYSEESKNSLVKNESLSLESLISLDSALHYYVKIRSDKKRMTRNEIVHLFLLLAEVFFIPDAITSGFAQDILLLSVATEIPIPRTNKLCIYQCEATDLDMEFKKVLLLSTIKFIDIPGISTVMREKKFLQGLLMILHPTEGSRPILWGPVLWNEIQATTLSILPVIIPILIQDFVISDSGKKIIDLSIHFSKKMDYDSVLSYMKALSAVRKANYLDSVNYLLNINAVPFLKDMIAQLLKSTFTPKAQAIILHALYLLHYLVTCINYDLEMDGKSLLSLSLTIIITYFSSSADNKYSNASMLISAVNLIRECLLTSYELKKVFVEMGGIFIILDLMKVAPLLVKTVSLSLLVDLSLNDDFVTHMLMWRGGQCLQAIEPLTQEKNPCETLEKCCINSKELWLLPLLMQIWRLEEKKLQVLRTSEGLVSDFRAPLMGKDQRIWMTSKQKQIEESFSFSEINTSARAKIYCIISILKYHLESKTRPFHLSFEKYVDALSRKDQVTLKLAENYRYMKTGEMWLEESLKSQTNKYRTSAIDLVCERSIKWTKHVTSEQEQLLLKGTNAELMTEENAYKCIINAHLAPEYESVQKLQFQARTSNAYILKKAVSSQKEEIMNSLKFPQDSINHRTYPARAKTTVVAPSKNFHENLIH